MNRERFDDLLDDWASGRLPKGDASEFEALLLQNPQLRSEAESHRAFLQLVRSAPPVAAPSTLLPEALRKARQSADRNPYDTHQQVIDIREELAQRRRARATPRRWMLSAAAGILVLFGGYAAYHNMKQEPAIGGVVGAKNESSSAPLQVAMLDVDNDGDADLVKEKGKEVLPATTSSVAENAPRDRDKMFFASSDAKSDQPRRALEQLLNDEVGADGSRDVAAAATAVDSIEPVRTESAALGKQVAAASERERRQNLDTLSRGFAARSGKKEETKTATASPAMPGLVTANAASSGEAGAVLRSNSTDGIVAGSVSQGDIQRVPQARPSLDSAVAGQEDKRVALADREDNKSQFQDEASRRLASTEAGFAATASSKPGEIAEQAAAALESFPPRDLVFFQQQARAVGGSILPNPADASGRLGGTPAKDHLYAETDFTVATRQLVIEFENHAQFRDFLVRLRRTPLPVLSPVKPEATVGGGAAQFLDITRYAASIFNDQATGGVVLTLERPTPKPADDAPTP